MNPNRLAWNQRQKILRRLLTSGGDHPAAIRLFLQQHAAVHTAQLAGDGGWSFADEVWQDLRDEQARCIPPNGEHSIAWLIWHLARIEDVTMNVLLAGQAQVFQDGWFERLGIPERHTGNLMRPEEITRFSTLIDLSALREYRTAVGRSTCAAAQALEPADLGQKVSPARLQRLLDEGAVIPSATGLLDYWGGLTHAGLLLMPPTRHNFIHLNEALRLRAKLKR